MVAKALKDHIDDKSTYDFGAIPIIPNDEGCCPTKDLVDEIKSARAKIYMAPKNDYETPKLKRGKGRVFKSLEGSIFNGILKQKAKLFNNIVFSEDPEGSIYYKGRT